MEFSVFTRIGVSRQQEDFHSGKSLPALGSCFVARPVCTVEAGGETARRLLAGTALPAALVAGTTSKQSAPWECSRASVSIPGQLPMTGYDDTRFARLSAVDLTTASQDTIASSRRAVEAAARRIEQPDLPPQRIAIEPRLGIALARSERGEMAPTRSSCPGTAALARPGRR